MLLSHYRSMLYSAAAQRPVLTTLLTLGLLKRLVSLGTASVQALARGRARHWILARINIAEHKMIAENSSSL
jgi:thioredoxin-like negative regulator of GroEL